MSKSGQTGDGIAGDLLRIMESKKLKSLSPEHLSEAQSLKGAAERRADEAEVDTSGWATAGQDIAFASLVGIAEGERKKFPKREGEESQPPPVSNLLAAAEGLGLKDEAIPDPTPSRHDSKGPKSIRLLRYGMHVLSESNASKGDRLTTTNSVRLRWHEGSQAMGTAFVDHLRVDENVRSAAERARPQPVDVSPIRPSRAWWHLTSRALVISAVVILVFGLAIVAFGAEAMVEPTVTQAGTATQPLRTPRPAPSSSAPRPNKSKGAESAPAQERQGQQAEQSNQGQTSISINMGGIISQTPGNGTANPTEPSEGPMQQPSPSPTQSPLLESSACPSPSPQATPNPSPSPTPAATSGPESGCAGSS